MPCSQIVVVRLYLGHIRDRRGGAADSHSCLQVVDEVGDGSDEDEEDKDDEEDDNVALHGCGGVVGWKVCFRSDLVVVGSLSRDGFCDED